MVGLTTNSLAAGGGGGGSVIQSFMQVNTFTVGQWVRVDNSGTYVLAKADNAQDAETLGVVIAATPTMFTLQQSGYIQSSQNIFNFLSPGNAYFLDTLTSGNMVITDATINGQVSRPVFIPDTPSSGWVVPYRGMIVGGPAPSGGTGGGGFGLTWNVINVGGTYPLSSKNGYIITANSLVTLTMPLVFAVGDPIIIYNYGTAAGQYLVNTQLGQSIRFSNQTAIISIGSTLIGDSLTMIGIVPNFVLGVTSASGNQTVI